MKRREFIKKAAYVAPAIVTLNVVPTLAAAGSYSGSTNTQTWDRDRNFWDRDRDRWHRR